MKPKSWNINRRQFVRGGGVALALPFLQGMSWGKTAGKVLPKRMVVSYIAYGVYEPKTEDGSHHDWNWWPCKDAGPLAFNRSSAPFAPLKDSVSYLKGLEHAGGVGMGGHSSGDVFATGADMTASEKTNNVSVDQVAAKLNGHHTRYPSLVLGTEGGTGSYGSAKTLSHYGPGRPIPSMHRPQEIFNRLFKPYAGRGVEQVRADLKREASVLDLMLDDSKRLHRRLGKEDQGKVDEYLESIRALEKRVERTSQWTHEPLPNVDTKGLNLEVSHKDPEEYTRCMYDLLYLALQTDSTRFATLMLESEHSSGSEMWNYTTYVLGTRAPPTTSPTSDRPNQGCGTIGGPSSMLTGASRLLRKGTAICWIRR